MGGWEFSPATSYTVAAGTGDGAAAATMAKQSMRGSSSSFVAELTSGNDELEQAIRERRAADRKIVYAMSEMKGNLTEARKTTQRMGRREKAALEGQVRAELNAEKHARALVEARRASKARKVKAKAAAAADATGGAHVGMKEQMRERVLEKNEAWLAGWSASVQAVGFHPPLLAEADEAAVAMVDTLAAAGPSTRRTTASASNDRGAAPPIPDFFVGVPIPHANTQGNGGTTTTTATCSSSQKKKKKGGNRKSSSRQHRSSPTNISLQPSKLVSYRRDSLSSVCSSADEARSRPTTPNPSSTYNKGARAAAVKHTAAITITTTTAAAAAALHPPSAAAAENTPVKVNNYGIGQLLLDTPTYNKSLGKPQKPRPSTAGVSGTPIPFAKARARAAEHTKQFEAAASNNNKPSARAQVQVAKSKHTVRHTAAAAAAAGAGAVAAAAAAVVTANTVHITATPNHSTAATRHDAFVVTPIAAHAAATDAAAAGRGGPPQSIWASLATGLTPAPARHAPAATSPVSVELGEIAFTMSPPGSVPPPAERASPEHEAGMAKLLSSLGIKEGGTYPHTSTNPDPNPDNTGAATADDSLAQWSANQWAANTSITAADDDLSGDAGDGELSAASWRSMTMLDDGESSEQPTDTVITTTTTALPPPFSATSTLASTDHHRHSLTEFKQEQELSNRQWTPIKSTRESSADGVSSSQVAAGVVAASTPIEQRSGVPRHGTTFEDSVDTSLTWGQSPLGTCLVRSD
jgi:hypothetical protein